MALHQLESDDSHLHRIYDDAIEENGRLTSQIESFLLNSQSEQDVLCGEVKRREEAIQRQKSQQVKLLDVINKQEERVSQVLCAHSAVLKNIVLLDLLDVSKLHQEGHSFHH